MGQKVAHATHAVPRCEWGRHTLAHRYGGGGESAVCFYSPISWLLWASHYLLVLHLSFPQSVLDMVSESTPLSAEQELTSMGSYYQGEDDQDELDEL